MEFTHHKENGRIEYFLQGKLTFFDHSTFKQILDSLAQDTTHSVVIDCAKLEFMDSAGLGMLLLALDTANANQVKLALRSPQAQVKMLFELSRFYELFDIK